MSVRVVGKFLQVGSERFLIRGVAYGTFAPGSSGDQFPPPDRLAADFGAMAGAGINTVRTYTAPPNQLLDQAAEAGLHLFAGVPWAQHVAFLDDRKLARAARQEIVRAVRRLARHPATLLIAIGNEIPAGVVRWHGSARIEEFLRETYDEAKAAAPDALLAYVNYPPTDYLDLGCFDVCAFNVYLHREADLRAYLAHLQLVAGGRPLVLAEAGADSLREGRDGQASLAGMQVRTAFEEGVAGVVVFSWTDEWWRGGAMVDDWQFGLTDAARAPKPSLAAVARAYGAAGFPADARHAWPRVTVSVCARNAADTLDACLRSIRALDYPDYEVIVVNDGSTDATGAIAREHPGVTVIDTPHGGLSAARNAALHAGAGDLIAYTDADVEVDPAWLTYLVQPFLRSDAAGAGGPNVVPEDDPWRAQCVARAPGGPTHVLIDERTAEHVPGCNMAYRREALLAIGGFDPAYHAAGDDVDVCWRLQARGQRIGFAPSALVWHRHRRSVRAYWRQQVGYGEAETQLMGNHPERFLNGHAVWKGRIYSPLPFVRAISRVRVNAGVWGTAAFPSVYSAHIPSMTYVPHLMEWQVGSVLLGVTAFACFWIGQPEFGGVAAGASVSGIALTVWKCVGYGWRTELRGLPRIRPWGPRASRGIYRAMIAWLHLVQPVARGWGRLRGRLWPPEVAARRIGEEPSPRADWPRDAMRALRLMSRGRVGLRFWSEHWVDRADLLTRIARRLETASVGRAIDAHDTWQQERDLAVATGRWGWLDLRTLLEEHGQGRCLFRVTARHRLTPFGATVGVGVAAGVGASLAAGSIAAAAVFGAVGLVAAARMGLQIAQVDAGVRAIIAEVAQERAMQSMTGAPATAAAATVADASFSRGWRTAGRERLETPRSAP
ncbi:MAG: glycosyltransferase [Acidobacteria bacterium]|nr:glycosyltransferase [Acidobacteriota bacterium]MYD70358.1 glycosyltransferase [Acidobacteriota bacterium]MYJ04222.1 glycosyltransferase [Acidobacteriota bacterium]